MASADPVQAIRDAITELEEQLAPLDKEIQVVRDEADERVAEIEERGTASRQQLRRWRQALAHAEGTTLPAPEGRRARTPWKLDDAQLLKVLRDAGPQGASDLRRALSLGEDVTAAALTRSLGDAAARGVVTRTGQRRATRYAVPE